MVRRVTYGKSTLPKPLTLLAERRKPSGECPVYAAKPEGSRPAATETQSKVSATGLTPNS